MPNFTWTELIAIFAGLLTISNLIKNWWNGSHKIHHLVDAYENEPNNLKKAIEAEDIKIKNAKEELDKKIDNLEDELQNVIDEQTEINQSILDEQTIIIYGVLACLKGLVENGADGPCHEAIDKIEKHLNKSAHHL